MSSLFSIDIPRRHRACSHKGEPFEPEDAYFSVLIEEDKGGFSRKDYCPHCWEEVKLELMQKTHIHWKSSVPLKRPESDLPKERNKRALVLLRQALVEETAEAKEEAFVLALLLLRAREIFLRQELVEGNLIEVAETEEMLLVPRLDLSRLQTETIQERLSVKFRD